MILKLKFNNKILRISLLIIISSLNIIYNAYYTLKLLTLFMLGIEFFQFFIFFIRISKTRKISKFNNKKEKIKKIIICYLLIVNTILNNSIQLTNPSLEINKVIKFSKFFYYKLNNSRKTFLLFIKEFLPLNTLPQGMRLTNKIMHSLNGNIKEKTNHSLKIVTKNINGKFESQIPEIKNLLEDDIDILCLQEIKLFEDDYLTTVEIDNMITIDFNLNNKNEIENEYQEKKRNSIENNLELSNEDKLNEIKFINPNNAKPKGGIATIYHNKLDSRISLIYKDIKKRFLIHSIQITETDIILLINIYAPADSSNVIKENFFQELYNEIKRNKANLEKSSNCEIKLILTGDFNITLSQSDRFSPNNTNINQKIPDSLNKIINEFDLKDSFREINPNKQSFSFEKVDNSSNTSVFKNQSRIDFFLASKQIFVFKCDLLPKDKMLSDHKAVLLEIEITPMTTVYVENYQTKIKLNSLSEEEILNCCKEINYSNYPTLEKNIRGLRTAIFTNKSKLTKLIIINEYLEELNKIITNRISDEINSQKSNSDYKHKPFVDSKKVRELKSKMNKIKKALSLLNQKIMNPNDENNNEKFNNILTKLDINKNNTNLTFCDLLKTKRKSINRKIKNEIQYMKRENISRKINKRLEQHDTDFKKYVRSIFPKSKYEKRAEFILHETLINNNNNNNNNNQGRRIKRITNPNEVKLGVQQFWKNFFSSKTNEKYDTPKWLSENKEPKIKFNESPITLNEIISVMKKMKKDKAPGPDNIPIEVLRNLPQQILNDITFIMNTCLEMEEIPEMWQVGSIKLIPKSKDKGNPSNFRPITLLQVLYKVFTNILEERLYQFVTLNNFISPYQAGFRKGYSTFSQINILNNILEDKIQFNKEIHLIYIDFKKAYDSVEHWALKQILTYYKIPESIVNLIFNIHNKSKSFISLNIGDTEEFNLNRGIRQGDGIAPLLFILFINPLIEIINKQEGYNFNNNTNLNISSLAFADDISLISNTRNKIENLFKLVQEYSIYYGIEISEEKSVYSYHSPNGEIFLPINHNNINLTTISSNSSYKYLGILTNILLSRKENFENVISKIKNKLHILHSKSLAPELKVELINRVILPALAYHLHTNILDKTNIKDLNSKITEIIKHSLSLPKRIRNEQFWIKKKDSGFDLNEVETQNHKLFSKSFLFQLS